MNTITTQPHVTTVAVSQPEVIVFEGREYETAIFKKPVSGPVAVLETNLEGDRQADLSVHGGVVKSVYCYPADHYPVWAAELGRESLEPAQFGENLTIAGLTEEDVHPGDVLKIGTALFEVTQPRTPCAKLGARMGDRSFVATFFKTQRTGYYLRVLETGTLQAGDPVEHLKSGLQDLSIRDLWRVALVDREDKKRAEYALSYAYLDPEFREPLEKRFQ